MKSLIELLNESIVTESHFMDTVSTAHEASDRISKKYKTHIEYIGDRPEHVAEVIFDYYGVKSVYAKNDERLLIPCSKEIERDFCSDEDTCEEKMSEIGLNTDDFEW